jgi:hypothetical protein
MLNPSQKPAGKILIISTSLAFGLLISSGLAAPAQAQTTLGGGLSGLESGLGSGSSGGSGGLLQTLLQLCGGYLGGAGTSSPSCTSTSCSTSTTPTAGATPTPTPTPAASATPTPTPTSTPVGGSATPNFTQLETALEKGCISSQQFIDAACYPYNNVSANQAQSIEQQAAQCAGGGSATPGATSAVSASSPSGIPTNLAIPSHVSRITPTNIYHCSTQFNCE